MDEGFENNEVITAPNLEVLKTTPKIEVNILEKEIVSFGGEETVREITKRLEDDKVEEKLKQFERFLYPYTKQKVADGLKINLNHGMSNGSGEVVGGVLSVMTQSIAEMKEVDAKMKMGEVMSDDKNTNNFFEVVKAAGLTYTEVALDQVSSTVMHESEHMIIDSRPNSELSKHFEEITKIENDLGNHTMSFLDEGIVYAFQFSKDSTNENFNKIVEENSNRKEEDKVKFEEKSYVVTKREELGRILQPKVEEYIKDGIPIDDEFFKFAGEEMKKLNIEKYVTEAEHERMDRNRKKLEKILPEQTKTIEKWKNFECRELDNPTEVLEKLVVEGYCFHGSSRKIDGDLVPQQAIDLVKDSGNEQAIYMTINPLLAEFAGLYGGVEGITKRENVCHMEINEGKVSYPGESFFGVNDPDKAVPEGYIYVFDKKTQGFEEINGEILSKQKIEPLMVIKVKKEDFKYPVAKI